MIDRFNACAISLAYGILLAIVAGSTDCADYSGLSHTIVQGYYSNFVLCFYEHMGICGYGHMGICGYGHMNIEPYGCMSLCA